MLTGNGNMFFLVFVLTKRPMSENTVTGALRRLGYTSDEMTGHGFRSMACTILNEQGWNRDAIERQLAHASEIIYALHITMRSIYLTKKDDATLGGLSRSVSLECKSRTVQGCLNEEYKNCI